MSRRATLRIPWTSEEDAYLVDQLDRMGDRELADAMDGRTLSAVRGRLRVLGLTRSPERIRTVRSATGGRAAPELTPDQEPAVLAWRRDMLDASRALGPATLDRLLAAWSAAGLAFAAETARHNLQRFLDTGAMREHPPGIYHCLSLLLLMAAAVPAMAQGTRHVTLSPGDSLTLPAGEYDIGLAEDGSEFWVFHLGTGTSTSGPLSRLEAFVPADTLDEARAALDSLAAEIDALRARLEAQPPPGDPDAAALRTALQAARDSLSALAATNADLQSANTTLEQSNATLTSSNATLNETLAFRTRQRDALQGQLAQAERNNERLAALATARLATIEQRQATIEEREGTIREQAATIAAREATIAEQGEEIVGLTAQRVETDAALSEITEQARALAAAVALLLR